MSPVFLPTAPDTRTPVGVEFGAKYALMAPNGERVVFNDRSDRDFIGFLVGDDAVAGLERGTVRTNIDPLSEADGAVAGPQWYGEKPWTLAGMIDPVDKLTQNRYIDKLMRATDAMTADALLLWTPTGGVPVQVAAQQTQATRITTRWPKKFLVAMTSPDPRIYSQALHLAQLVSPATSVDVQNVGSGDSWPVLTFYGPCTNPVVTNTQTGAVMEFDANGGLSLLSGEWAALDTNPAARTLTKNTGLNLYDKIDFAASTWICLQGNATNTLTVSYASGGYAMGVQWRDAWK